MAQKIRRKTVRKIFDGHNHLRDGEGRYAVLPDTLKRCSSILMMPNLSAPLTTPEMCAAYIGDIYRDIDSLIRRKLVPESAGDFIAHAAMYLTDKTSPQNIKDAVAWRGRNGSRILAMKYYPPGATTNSDSGVTDFRKIHKTLRSMEDCGMPLLLHGEVTDPKVDIFDREAAFIKRILEPLVKRYPKLRIVLEHITTRDAVVFVLENPNVYATITAHHLLLNRNDIFSDGKKTFLRPENFCLPILKSEPHRLALLKAATSGNPKFFLGTDSAPHSLNAKETCGCAGYYTAHASIELYTWVFAAMKALRKLEAFSSEYGSQFYGLPLRKEKITIANLPQAIPENYPYGESAVLRPLFAGQFIPWSLVNN